MRVKGRVPIAALLILCLYFTVGTPPVDAQSRSDLEVTIETPENDIAMDMVMDGQDNVVVVGRAQSPSIISDGFGKFYAVKVSSQGEVLWTKSWNVSSSDMLVSVDIDSADNILLAGVSNLTTDQVYGVLYKLDPDGEIVWSEEIPNLRYDWNEYWRYYGYFEIRTIPQSDDFLVIGSVSEDSNETFVARYNALGSMAWRTQWYGPSESLGSMAKTSWLSSRNWVIVSGLLCGGTVPWYPYDGPYIAAFDFNGSLVWNHTVYDLGYQVDRCYAGFEMNTNQYVCSADSWSGPRQIICRTYDFNETWNFDMTVGEYYSVTITGFLANETDNIIGYGEITSLLAGHAVTKSYRPKFQAPQPPQSILFSFSCQGELLWYDLLVIGRISDPCGCQLDSDGRLIVAGHTSPWSSYTQDFFIVFGFVQTPSPTHYDSLAFFVAPAFNVLALATTWTIGRAWSNTRRSQGAPTPRITFRKIVKVFLGLEAAIYAALYYYLVGFFGPGGPPSLLVYLPDWVAWFLSGLFCALAIPAIVYAVMWYRGRSVTP